MQHHLAAPAFDGIAFGTAFDGFVVTGFVTGTFCTRLSPVRCGAVHPD